MRRVIKQIILKRVTGGVKLYIMFNEWAHGKEAEFIVGIRTGQKIIKYGLIIAVLSIAISVLMFINNKSDKFDIKRGKNGKK